MKKKKPEEKTEEGQEKPWGLTSATLWRFLPLPNPNPQSYFKSRTDSFTGGFRCFPAELSFWRVVVLRLSKDPTPLSAKPPLTFCSLWAVTVPDGRRQKDADAMTCPPETWRVLPLDFGVFHRGLRAFPNPKKLVFLSYCFYCYFFLDSVLSTAPPLSF